MDHEGNRRRGQIMNAICERIGMSECLREWNRKTLPGAEFDAWWDHSIGGEAFIDELVARLT